MDPPLLLLLHHLPRHPPQKWLIATKVVRDSIVARTLKTTFFGAPDVISSPASPAAHPHQTVTDPIAVIFMSTIVFGHIVFLFMC